MPNKLPKLKPKKIKLGRNQLLIAVSALTAVIVLIVFVNFSSDESPTVKTAESSCSGLLVGSRCVPLERVQTDQTRSKGLSDRVSLPVLSGMLFEFDSVEKQCFWMKDMLFNLDIIWLDEQKKINKIERDVSPATYPNSFCSENTKYVLELNSGEATELGLANGQQMQL